MRNFIDIVNEALSPDALKKRIPDIGDMVKLRSGDDACVHGYMKRKPEGVQQNPWCRVFADPEIGTFWTVPCEKDEAEFLLMNDNFVAALDEVSYLRGSRVTPQYTEVLKHDAEVRLRGYLNSIDPRFHQWLRDNGITEALNTAHAKVRVPEIGDIVCHENSPREMFVQGHYRQEFVDGWYHYIPVSRDDAEYLSCKELDRRGEGAMYWVSEIRPTGRRLSKPNLSRVRRAFAARMRRYHDSLTEALNPSHLTNRIPAIGEYVEFDPTEAGGNAEEGIVTGYARMLNDRTWVACWRNDATYLFIDGCYRVPVGSVVLLNKFAGEQETKTLVNKHRHKVRQSVRAFGGPTVST